jgi:1,4-alpha-glucan branching enzyme
LVRKGKSTSTLVLAVGNLTPVPRAGYRIGAPRGGYWREMLNSDATEYGGSGVGNSGGLQASAAGLHGRPFSLTLTLPPLSVLFFANQA